MQDNIATVILAAGRILLGGLFVTGGIRHLFILVPVTNAIEARGIPWGKFVLLAGLPSTYRRRRCHGPGAVAAPWLAPS